MSTKITFLNIIVPLPGLHFAADFYVRATIGVTDFGTPESGRQTWGNPENYDPGSGPEWYVAGTPQLFLDSGGDGEAVTIGPQFSEALVDFLHSDKAVIEVIEREISKEHEGA